MTEQVKRTRKDCQFLIDVKMLPYEIGRIAGQYRLVSTATESAPGMEHVKGYTGIRSSVPVISWNAIYSFLDNCQSNAPAPDPEPAPVTETPAPVELES